MEMRRHKVRPHRRESYAPSLSERTKSSEASSACPIDYDSDWMERDNGPLAQVPFEVAKAKIFRGLNSSTRSSLM